jgi:hypothetical protein
VLAEEILIIRPSMRKAEVHPSQESFINRFAIKIYFSADPAHILAFGSWLMISCLDRIKL